MDGNSERREGRRSRAGDPLEQIARDVMDGRSVDWEVLRRAHPDLRSRIERLRTLDDLSRAFREPLTEGQATGRWGRFAILGTIAEGRSATIHLAVDPSDGSRFALKLFRRQERAAMQPVLGFLRDLERMACLRHPNLLAVHGVGIEDETAGLWSELVAGRTAEAALIDEGPLPPARILDLALHLARALDTLHRAGIVHGSVDTAKVRFTPDPARGTVLMDFGPTVRPDEIADRVRAGQPILCAPETLQGSVPGFASDVFSAGATLYRMATGRGVFESTPAGLGFLALRHWSVPSVDAVVPGFPRALARTIHIALAPHPADRYAGGGALLAALAGISGAAPAQA